MDSRTGLMQRNKADLGFYFFVVLQGECYNKKDVLLSNAEDRRLCLSVSEKTLFAVLQLLYNRKIVYKYLNQTFLSSYKLSFRLMPSRSGIAAPLDSTILYQDSSMRPFRAV